MLCVAKLLWGHTNESTSHTSVIDYCPVIARNVVIYSSKTILRRSNEGE